MRGMHGAPSTQLQPMEVPWKLKDKAFPGTRALGTQHREAVMRLPSQDILVGKRRDPLGDMPLWLERLYQRCQREEWIDVAIDQVIVAVDELLRQHDLLRCNVLLRTVDVSRLDVSVALALLMETLRAKHVLSSREGLYLRLEQRLRAEEPDEADALLANLR